MTCLEIALLRAGFVLLVRGWRRNRRGWLDAAALLLLSGNLGPFARESPKAGRPWPAATTDRRA